MVEESKILAELTEIRKELQDIQFLLQSQFVTDDIEDLRVISWSNIITDGITEGLERSIREATKETD